MVVRCYWGWVRRSYDMLAPFQQEHLGEMGFGHFLSIPNFPLRPMFLEAMAERYNFQTSSIVTRVGEFVLSLEDMARLIGLRVTGCPVTGRVHSDYTGMVRELVGRQVTMHGHQLVFISSVICRVKELTATVAGPGAEADQ